MTNVLAPTALSGRSRSGHDVLARGLGYFSIALGMAELLAPRALCRALGMEGHETLVRAYGAREVATGVAILASHDPTPWIMGRVAGDALDIATVAMGLRGDNDKQNNVIAAMGALVGVTALDVVCASGLMSEKGGTSTAVTDYSDRTGFPKSPESMRGAVAGQVNIPDDMRIPKPLRPDTFRQQRGQSAPSIPDAMTL